MLKYLIYITGYHTTTLLQSWQLFITNSEYDSFKEYTIIQNEFDDWDIYEILPK